MRTPIEILCDADWPGRETGRKYITLEDCEMLAELEPAIREAAAC